MNKYFPVVLFVLLFSLTSLPSCTRDTEPFVKQTFVMGTRGTITIYGLSDEDAGAAAADAVREMHRIESVMSTWKEDSEISKLNRAPERKPFKVSSELFLLLNKTIMFSKMTGGAFDVTAMPVV